MRNLGKFFDNKHFARGFSRSGEFTINEAQVLENYGKTMQGLFEGHLSPETEEEHNFIAAFQEGGEGVVSKYAQCWKKYLSKTQRKRTYTLCSTVKTGASSYDDDSDSDDLLIED
ncbi:DUF413 domain-containing protein [Vibrio aphrogenes]|uniref:DUF413 domain-containing protein n=1 Tax=Vibrio aphrogenes TaxID=1891186 RepID=UPI000B360DA6|nr:DUF413 domain-containing protein [Vibrio aphrogenes]